MNKKYLFKTLLQNWLLLLYDILFKVKGPKLKAHERHSWENSESLKNLFQRYFNQVHDLLSDWGL